MCNVRRAVSASNCRLLPVQIQIVEHGSSAVILVTPRTLSFHVREVNNASSAGQPNEPATLSIRTIGSALVRIAVMRFFHSELSPSAVVRGNALPVCIMATESAVRDFQLPRTLELIDISGVGPSIA